MPATAKITIIKRFTYRGNPEEWSNTYHFSGTTPPDDASWKALGEAFFNLEKNVLSPDNKLVRIYGYLPGAHVSVSNHDYVALGETLQAGVLTADANTQPMAGDQAIWIRALIGLNSKGKKKYVRKYYHGSFAKQVTPDSVYSGTQTRFQTLAAALLTPSLPGGAAWCGPNGEVPTQPLASSVVTTRTLKRRGKRPS